MSAGTNGHLQGRNGEELRSELVLNMDDGLNDWMMTVTG